MAVLFLAILLTAEAASDDPKVPSHRHLLVIETSRAMQRRAPAVQSIIADLFLSGMHGQLQDGDTLGIWTYAEELHTGRLPLQRWSTNANRAFARGLASFVQAQTNDGLARLDKVLPSLQQLVKDSEFLTVILVSSGEQAISGTPFDERVNATYRLWQSEQQRTQMPFITVFRAADAQLVSAAVTPAPWPVELPPVPLELRQRIAAAKKKPVRQPKPVAPAPAVPAAKALVFSGSDPTPGNSETPDAQAQPVEIRKAEPKPELAKAEVGKQGITPERMESNPEFFGPFPQSSQIDLAIAEVKREPARTDGVAANPAPVTTQKAESNEPSPAAPASVPVSPVLVGKPVAGSDTPSPEAAPVRDRISGTRGDLDKTKLNPSAAQISPALRQTQKSNPDPVLPNLAAVVHARTLSPEPEVSSAMSAAVGGAPEDPPWVARAIAITGTALTLTAVILFLMRKPRPARGSLITRSLDRSGSVKTTRAGLPSCP